MKRKIRGFTEEAEIDLTPMLDVTFIMLIFFIVTTSFVRESGLPVNRPSADQSQNQTPPKKVIGISISAVGEIKVEGRVSDQRAVTSNVQAALANKQDAPVIIAVAKGAPTGILVTVIDGIVAAGTTNISVASVAD